MEVNIALLTVTDTRTFENDKSGKILVEKIKEQNHKLIDRKIQEQSVLITPLQEVSEIITPEINKYKSNFLEKTKERTEKAKEVLDNKVNPK